MVEQKAIFLPLRRQEAEALVRLARREDRSPRDQAARLLRQALEREGVLPERDPHTEATEPELVAQ